MFITGLLSISRELGTIIERLGESLKLIDILVQYSSCKRTQKILKYGNIQNTILPIKTKFKLIKNSTF